MGDDFATGLLIATAIIIVIILTRCCCEHFISPRKINHTRRVTLHYTNWCGYCTQIKPTWAQVKAACKDSGIIFIELDEDIAKTPNIAGYPTIMMLDENGKTSRYNGRNDFQTLLQFVMTPVRNPEPV